MTILAIDKDLNVDAHKLIALINSQKDPQMEANRLETEQTFNADIMVYISGAAAVIKVLGTVYSDIIKPLLIKASDKLTSDEEIEEFTYKTKEGDIIVYKKISKKKK